MKRNKLVFGVGINDADYCQWGFEVVNGKRKLTWMCPIYIKWRDMLGRCYSPIRLKRYPTYIGCAVVEEWHIFSNFKAWVDTQDWENKDLDKDILIVGNKIYGPNTCVFVDKKVNYFMLERTASRGIWPMGVCFHKLMSLFMSQCKEVNTGKSRYLGCYNTPEEAHQAWLAFKLEQAYILAAEQKDERVAKALIDRYENYGNLPKAA